MHSNESVKKIRARGASAAIRLGLVALVSLIGGGFGASACLQRPLCDRDCRPVTTNIFVDTITQKSVDKIDLLFMIDNSISMADKQDVLKDAVPNLVKRLVSPNCVDPDTGVRLGDTPANPDADCSDLKATREFTPIKDIHIGVITSSLGDHGQGDTCLGVDDGTTNEQQDDHGRLIASRPRFANEHAKPAYTSLAFQPPEAAGFLDWNPKKRNGTQDIDQFSTTFKMMVTASSEFGCGLESQLEAIYRFLADPKPPASIVLQPCPGSDPNQKCAYPQGKDDNLLQQRIAFLRADSLVAVIMVTDENDCSIRDTQQFYYAANSQITLPKGSSVCGRNPNDPCCYSCAGGPPKGCAEDPTCKPPGSDPLTDSINLRCFQQKQRFGLDFLYPTKRYVNALSRTQLCTSRADLDFDVGNPNGTCPDADKDNQPDVVQNPLFMDLSNTGQLPRATNLVFFAGIVGVPWQDIQAKADKDGAAYNPDELHYMTAADIKNGDVWSVILGDPTASPPILPTDGLMVESRSPRPGNDVFKQLIPGPGSPANTINGHEWANTANDDLEYACILPLKAPRDCVQVEKAKPTPGCDCGEAFNAADSNPLCQVAVTKPGPQPDGRTTPIQIPGGTYGNMQYFAKGYPATRELTVLKDFGDNAIVASICARNLGTETDQDYGYNPAVDAIVDRLKEALSGRCLPRVLKGDPRQVTAEFPNGKIPCSVIEVRPTRTAGPCESIPGRATPDSKVIAPAKARLVETGVCGGKGEPACESFQLCEIKALPDTSECHKDVPQQPNAGWCYVDPASNANDDKSLVSKCKASEQRIIRFVDPNPGSTPAQGAQVLIACFGAQLDDD